MATGSVDDGDGYLQPPLQSDAVLTSALSSGSSGSNGAGGAGPGAMDEDIHSCQAALLLSFPDCLWSLVCHALSGLRIEPGQWSAPAPVCPHGERQHRGELDLPASTLRSSLRSVL